MVTSRALIHGDRDYLLGFDDTEHPLVLQIGGDEPKLMAECARIAEGYGYDGININVGCPSNRVQRGNFGACLMKTPEIVAGCVESMREACDIPVSVKHRIGVDDLDSYEDMTNFVRVVSGSGCSIFSVHARKAWLAGLSPKQNRTVPPLRYEDVYRLKKDFPDLFIELNGGVLTLEEAQSHLQHVDAVMIGRAAYDRPFMFVKADQLFGNGVVGLATREELVAEMIDYAALWTEQGLKLSHITRHLLNLFAGIPGTKRWKQILTEKAPRPDAGVEVIEEALAAVHEQQDRLKLAAQASHRI
jgi:tRNA-dihydrouridine synthase A